MQLGAHKTCFEQAEMPTKLPPELPLLYAKVSSDHQWNHSYVRRGETCSKCSLLILSSERSDCPLKERRKSVHVKVRSVISKSRLWLSLQSRALRGRRKGTVTEQAKCACQLMLCDDDGGF